MSCHTQKQTAAEKSRANQTTQKPARYVDSHTARIPDSRIERNLSNEGIKTGWLFPTSPPIMMAKGVSMMRTRRWMIGIAAGLFAVTAAFAGTISGRVFLDANGNGTFDVGEKGIAGCVVSDERAFGRSDDTGCYQLTLPAGPAAVFVVNASGTWPSARWWSYVADGSADATVDFPLRAQDQGGPLYFVHGTDVHLQTNAVSMYRRYVEHVNALPVPVKFVVHTGDLVIDSSMATMERARELFSFYENESKALKPSLRNVMGNHDNAGAVNPKLKGDEEGIGKTLYRQRFGPATYAFRYGPYHFIALDGTTLSGRTLSYGLTRESADWAIRYLAEVKRDEPIILMIHEPMFPEVAGVRQRDTPKTRPHEGRLLAALKGKKLLLTIAGHTHTRLESTWGGAPHRLGGAVSYAWHGIQPFPPAPVGYTLYRLSEGRIEHVPLDWAEERSIDVTTPAFTGVVRGRQKISGTVADFKGEISAVDCAIGGQTASAKVSRQGNLATAFEAVLDTSKLADGAYEFLVTASGGGKQWTERYPVMVVNDKHAEFTAAGGAKLSFRVDGKLAAPPQVTCNGRPLEIAASTATEIRCDVPADQLRRVNEIVIRASPSPGPKKSATIRSVSLDYNGKRCRDIRYAPGARRQLTSSVVSYIDLVFDDPVAPAK